ncbi:hypothetical protein ILUMI_09776 [Ignelater luminosus]|uniref:Elongation of very long chain fatty acids protein n=1 Tax=Ignelater luminosus TaxID=2038154 RepID=A0A8K0D8H3_IGNLU|nr:hypothetical protein ILUMI_09776 [Ignelater luminosus]
MKVTTQFAMITTAFTLHNFLFEGIADKRVYEWPLMSSPWKIFGIIGAYLVLIYIILPSYMEKRKSFALTNIIRLYNIFEIVTNTALIYGLATSGWLSHYTIGCQPGDYSSNEMALRMTKIMWIIAMLKIVQFIDTVFFILRKKYDLVTFLHVYHHVSTAIVTWICAKYFAGGMTSFPWFINAFVHLLMYSYYLLLSFPQTRNSMRGVKSKLTLIQIIQMIVMVVHSAQSLLPSCQVSSVYGIIMLPYLSVMLYFFVAFYYKSYIKKNV